MCFPLFHGGLDLLDWQENKKWGSWACANWWCQPSAQMQGLKDQETAPKELIWCEAFKLYQQTFVLGVNNECPSILFCNHSSSLSKAGTEKKKTSSSLSELGQSNGCAWLRSQMMVFAIHVFFHQISSSDQFFKFFWSFFRYLDRVLCFISVFTSYIPIWSSAYSLWY